MPSAQQYLYNDYDFCVGVARKPPIQKPVLLYYTDIVYRAGEVGSGFHTFAGSNYAIRNTKQCSLARTFTAAGQITQNAERKSSSQGNFQTGPKNLRSLCHRVVSSWKKFSIFALYYLP